MFQPNDIAKFFRVMEALNEKGIKVTDWDDKEVEVQFPNGDKKRYDKFWATSYLTKELNK